MGFLVLVIQIVLLDLLLSGDNAVVIAAVANTLPKSQRNIALAYGIGIAIFLRILLTFIAGLLLHIKIISVIGGLFLFYVAYKLVKEALSSQSSDSPVLDESPKNIIAAVTTILLADVFMSLDNVAAVAALSKGNLGAIIAGLGLSVAILGVGAKAVSLLLETHRWLMWVGAVLVAWVGVTLII